MPGILREFFINGRMSGLPQPVRLFFCCHLSIAFAIGHLLDPKSGVQVIPAQLSPFSGYDLWPVPKDRSGAQAWDWEVVSPAKQMCGGIASQTEVSAAATARGRRIVLAADSARGKIAEEVVVAVSVTHPLEQHLLPSLAALGLDHMPRLSLKPKTGLGAGAVKGADHAWQLGDDLQRIVRTVVAADCRVLHVFMAVPVALAFILGSALRHVTPSIQLYEHDFEGRRGSVRYEPSVLLPI